MRMSVVNFVECVSLDAELCRVGLEFPKIEVRFQNLKVETYVHVGSRALPTIPNFICNMTEVLTFTFLSFSMSFVISSFVLFIMEF